jgi:glycopeptide antibiotics resistance protein
MTFTPASDSQQNSFVVQVLQGSGSTWRALTHPNRDWQDPVGNVLLFIPISVALTALVGSIITRISLLMLTISIEISQFVIGYGRTAELIDIALNYAGVEIGIALTVFATRLKQRKDWAN